MATVVTDGPAAAEHILHALLAHGGSQVATMTKVIMAGSEGIVSNLIMPTRGKQRRGTRRSCRARAGHLCDDNFFQVPASMKFRPVVPIMRKARHRELTQAILDNQDSQPRLYFPASLVMSTMITVASFIVLVLLLL
jgi:hypothetical protein